MKTPKEEHNYNMKQEILAEMERLEEEPKQETIEEAMNKNGYHDTKSDKLFREGVEFGVKWQKERSYSEEDSITGLEGDEWYNSAKQCALIAVDEMIEVLSKDINPIVNYWFEVKQEINNL